MINRKSLLALILVLAWGIGLYLSRPVHGQPEDAPWASYIAFSSRHWTGVQSINMINAATGQFHILTSGMEDSVKPFWSPDGVQLAFTRYAQIYLLENAGQSVSERVVDGAFSDTNIAWRPDGSGFATTTGLTDLASGNTQSWAMNPHPGYNLTWSPDGQVLMFDPPIYDERDEQSQLLDMASGEVHPTLQVEGITATCCGIWSPDGAEIALLITIQGVDQLVVFAPGDTDYRVLAQFERPEPGTSFLLAWSPDGLHLAYVTSSGLLYVVNLRDFPNPQLVAQHVSYDRYGLQKFDWSPDGKQIAYISTDSYHSYLYIIQADGSNQSQLFSNESIVGLDWQPAQLHAGGQARVAVIDAEGLKMRTSPDLNGEVVDHLPDGAVVDVLAGPESDSYLWWNVQSAGGQQGWSVQGADGIVTLLPRPVEFTNLVYIGEPTPDPQLPLFGTATLQPTGPVDLILGTPTVAGMTCVVVIAEDTYLYSQPGGNENSADAYLPTGSVLNVDAKAVSDGQTWWRWKDGNWLPEDKLTLTDGCASLPPVEF